VPSVSVGISADCEICRFWHASVMARLDSSDQVHLEAAQGWLGLSDWREANEELDRITPAMRAHPSVLRTRILVCIAAEKWDLMHGECASPALETAL
jgi:hypothetical protein